MEENLRVKLCYVAAFGSDLNGGRANADADDVDAVGHVVAWIFWKVVQQQRHKLKLRIYEACSFLVAIFLLLLPVRTYSWTISTQKHPKAEV